MILSWLWQQDCHIFHQDIWDAGEEIHLYLLKVYWLKKGILLIPGLLKEARDIILMFASSLRHGLIPNLLDKG